MPTTSDSTSAAVRVAEYFAASPSAMTMLAARDLELPESEVVRHLPENRSTELRADRFEQICRRFERAGSLFVLVSNRAATVECRGEFGGFSRSGEFFNVQTDSLDMHIRDGRIKSAFAVEKPSHLSGVPTVSFQFFDDEGAAAMKVFFTFGQKEPSSDVLERWSSIRDEFRL